MRAANGMAVSLYRRSKGRIGGKAGGGTPVLLLTVPGRKTGTPRTAPVSYFEAEGGYVVTGTSGGSKVEPQWFRNLRAAPSAHVELGAKHLDVVVHVASDADRDRVWRDVVLARAPSFAKYEKKSGRAIPVAILTPTSSSP
jgi:deazaflavin-dependent oxidoreductase (nitroreductase family)